MSHANFLKLEEREREREKEKKTIAKNDDDKLTDKSHHKTIERVECKKKELFSSRKQKGYHFILFSNHLDLS